MPILADRPYRTRFRFRNPHVHTIWASKVRSVPAPGWTRQRINTPDGDFLDVDLLQAGHPTAVVLLHGLEGSTDRTYMRGMARAVADTGRDVVAVNFRSCSGTPNLLPRSYHSGATEDLRVVLDVLCAGYERIEGIGFSLGGNLLLKYLGEEGQASRIQAAVAVSVPCDLATSADELAKPGNRLYMWNFMRSLREKMLQKAEQFPGQIDTEGLADMRTFHEFDNRYTAPLHGFRDAADYWASCSSRFFLPDITIPTLLLTAADDPFLSPECYPVDICQSSRHVTLEMPSRGGHVGFLDGAGTYVERRAPAFLDSVT